MSLIGRLTRWFTRPLPLVIVVALLAVAWPAVSILAPRPAPAYALVDDTTLVVLQGEVQVQRPSADWTPVVTDTPVRVGDRVRTAAESYACVTYFDGSTTCLDPSSEILLQRLDRLDGGGVSISIFQEAGRTWNRVEKLLDAHSRFETQSGSSVAFVRGTEYRVEVGTDGQSMVDAVTDSVGVSAENETVILDPGSRTSAARGRRPSAPELAPAPPLELLIEMEGLARPFLMDSRNRAVGFHPQADAYGSQIPGATYRLDGDRQRLRVPDPAQGYTLLFAPVGEGGAYTFKVSGWVNGQRFEPTVGRLDPTANLMSGTVEAGQMQFTRFEFRDGEILNLAALTPGAPPALAQSRMLFLNRQRGTAANVVRTAVTQSGRRPRELARLQAATATAVPTDTPEPTPTSTPEPPAATPTEEPTATAQLTVAAQPTSTRPAAPTNTPAPPPTRTPTRVPGPSIEPNALERELLALINNSRLENGLRPLAWDGEAAVIARDHNLDMIQRGYLGHTAPNGVGPAERFRQAGMQPTYWAENLAVERSIAEGHDAVMNDPAEQGHKRNVLYPGLNRVGISIITLDDGRLQETVLFLQ